MDETQPLLTSSETTREIYDGSTSNGPKLNIVSFDPNGDAENPKDWPMRYRYGVVLLLAFMAFTVTFACVGVVPVADRIVRDLEGKEDRSASVLFVTIWELGEAAGPLLIAPLSEVYGRYMVFNVANVGFIVGILLAALSPTAWTLIIARFLTGCAVASNVLNPAVIGDIFPPELRGSGMSAVFLAPLFGGAIGPAIAGSIAETLGWRCILWIALALAIAAELAFLTLFSETYPVLILRRRAARLRRETGNEQLRTIFDEDDANSSSALWKSIVRPVHVFASSSVLQLLSLWGGVAFSFFYVMSTSLPQILQYKYGFSSAMTGTAFITFSIGSFLGIFICNALVDRVYVRLQRGHDEKIYPEGRLPLPIAGACILPVFVVLYGLSSGQHWPVWTLLIIVVFLGVLVLVALVPMMTYVTDAFGVYSASALTAVLVTRCLMGTFLPLVTAALTNSLDYSLAFLVISGFMLVLAPIPALIMRYGSKWRQTSEFTQSESRV